MPKRKQRKVKAPPKEQLSLTKDESNTKGSKEERARAFQMLVDDFDIQALSVSKHLVKQFQRAFAESAIARFNALVKQIPKDILDMPYDEVFKLDSDLPAVAVEEEEEVVEDECSLQKAKRQKKREELVAELEAQIPVQNVSMNPALVTPANVPMPAATPLTLATEGRKPQQGEAIILTARSARGSPISLWTLKEALSIRHDLTPYVTAAARRAV